jgi:hypothetical protein
MFLVRIYENTVVVWVKGRTNWLGVVFRNDGKTPPDCDGDPERAVVACPGVKKMKLICKGRLRVWYEDGMIISLRLPIANGVGFITAWGTPR